MSGLEFRPPIGSEKVKITRWALVSSRKRRWWQRLLRRPAGRVILEGDLENAMEISGTLTPVYLKLLEQEGSDQ